MDRAIFLNRKIDAAQAEIYNEYAQVLEAVNPERGELYQPEDRVVPRSEEVAPAMLGNGYANSPPPSDRFGLSPV